MIEVGVGAYIPLKSLYNVMGVAPGMSIYFSFPSQNNHFAVELGAGLYFSTQKKIYFEEKGFTYQMFYFMPTYIRCKYQFRVAKYFYIAPYVGGGVHFSTIEFHDKSDYYENDYEIKKTVTAVKPYCDDLEYGK